MVKDQYAAVRIAWSVHTPTPHINMKLHHTPRGGRLLLLGSACLGTVGMAFGQQENIPRGKLSVDNTLLRVGAKSNLTWQISYTDKVTDLVEIKAPQVIIPKEELRVRVRIIGSGMEAIKTDSGHGNNLDGYDSSNTGNKAGTDASAGVDDERKTIGSSSIDLPVEVSWSSNKSSWTRVFYGPQSSVDSTILALDTVIQAGETMDLAARCFTTSWQPQYGTNTGTSNVLVLKNGDAVPRQLATKQYGQIQGFLKPYLSSDGKKVKIGNRDLLVLFELDKTNPNAAGFDYQDIGALVTFD